MNPESIDWSCWTPKDVATLLFVVRGDEVLLIRKKRGLGAGKFNGPGGRLEPGETPLACAIREVEEELCITPREVEPCGELSFQFVDGYALHAHLFRADAYEGRPTETDEATPHWFPIEELPFDEMWQDDKLWLPRVLARESVRGWFVFDGDAMLWHRLSAGA
ncbi:MAG: 8-oxo-dGTP diphosphatase [Deltaproteobacteria bacterium]|nr:8-oxo-dGTP diphosphatase [Deltaproteobacteria bacterium]